MANKALEYRTAQEQQLGYGWANGAAGCKHCDFRRVCRHDTLRTALTGQETDTVGSFLPRPHNARKSLAVLLQAEDEATVERDSP